MMSAFGIDYRSAGENVGFESGYGGGSASASQVNTDFMNSSAHRNNILNSNYTDLGVGSATAASGWNYPGGAGPYSDVWMFAEEFAQIGSPPPPPTPPPPPAEAPGFWTMSDMGRIYRSERFISDSIGAGSTSGRKANRNSVGPGECLRGESVVTLFCSFDLGTSTFLLP